MLSAQPACIQDSCSSSASCESDILSTLGVNICDPVDLAAFRDFLVKEIENMIHLSGEGAVFLDESLEESSFVDPDMALDIGLGDENILLSDAYLSSCPDLHLPTDDSWRKFDFPEVNIEDLAGPLSNYEDYEALIDECLTSGDGINPESFDEILEKDKELYEMRQPDSLLNSHMKDDVSNKTSICSIAEPWSPSMKVGEEIELSASGSDISLFHSYSKSVGNQSSSRAQTPAGKRNARSHMSSRGTGSRRRATSNVKVERLPPLDNCVTLRPDTPQSLAESEDDFHPAFKHSLDYVVSSAASSICGGPSIMEDEDEDDDDRQDISGYDSLTFTSSKSSCDTWKFNRTNLNTAKSRKSHTGRYRSVLNVKTEPTTSSVPSSSNYAYYNDHSYHQCKDSVSLDSLGVQTPSESEEEIDVVSVGEKAPVARPVALPHRPTPRDRQQIQRNVACAMKRGARGRGAASRRGRTRRANGGSDSEPDSCERRSLHNNMERQRRIDLRNLVENLRGLVPAVSGNQKAAKVVILREAAKHVRALATEEGQKLEEIAHMRRRQERLLARVSSLRRCLAAQR